MKKTLSLLLFLCASMLYADSALQEISGFSEVFGGNANMPLPVEKVFIPTITPNPDGHSIHVELYVEPNHYLYKDKISVELTGAAAGKLPLPKGKEKDDPFFGKMIILRDAIITDLPITRTNKDATQATFTFKYQGCSDKGICYPPQANTFTLELPTVTSDTPATTQSPTANTPLSEQDALAARLASGNVWLTVLAFFGLGLLLAFTPCIFPMIPILSSIIAGQGDAITPRRAFVLSLIYVLAMAIAYTIAGVLAGLFGANLQAAFQNPWILGSFALVFVLLAFSMFGFFELQLSGGLQNKITNLSNKQQGGSWVGVAVMGFLSALIVGPCVAPPLMGALIYIGQTGDALLGGAALFALSLGMGLPLVAVGTLGGSVLPKAGAWMDKVKRIFGFVMLGLAIWLIDRVIPTPVSLILAGLLTVAFVFTLGLFDQASTWWGKLWRIISTALFAWGLLTIVGGITGSNSWLNPVGHLTGATQKETLVFERIKSTDDLQTKLAEAAANNRPVMLDFYADWCIACKELEHLTFTDDTLKAKLAVQNYVLLQADVTDNDAIDKTLMKSLEIIGPPAIYFWDTTGVELKHKRLFGFKPADEFISHLP